MALVDRARRVALDCSQGVAPGRGRIELRDGANVPTGCRFHPRCPYAMPVCRAVEPRLADQGRGQAVACHLYPGSQ